MTGIGSLPDGHVSVVVFGPGYGESVAVRGPDGRWLVIDALRDAGSERNPAVELLKEHRAAPDVLLLTHPHEDHAAGFAELVERQRPSGQVGAVPAPPLDDRDPLRHPDTAAALRASRTRLALTAIQERWAQHPTSRWAVEAGAKLSLGPLELEVLTPRPALVEKAPSNANRLSAAILASWGGLRLLLGADVPAVEWGRVDGAVALGDHALFKVAHHGSKRSRHARLRSTRALSPVWIMTPWIKGGNHLPRLGQGQDLDLALGDVEAIELTSSPVDLQATPAGSVSSAELDQLAQRSRFGGDDLVLEYDDAPRSSEHAWVAAVFRKTGDVMDVRRGDAAVHVARKSSP